MPEAWYSFGMSQGWRFALPPSLGREPVRELALRFADILYDVGFSTILPQESYARLEQRLLAGEVDAAWGPPLVCARVEQVGGRVLRRAVRHGAASYRAAILCRSDDRLQIADLGRTRRRPRAAWVDEASMSGYILPRAFLRKQGIAPEKAFLQEERLGSFVACLQAVLDGTADVTATYASPAGARREVSAHRKLAGYRAAELRVLAYTDETPNDGIVLSPRLDGASRYALQLALERVIAHPATKPLLAEAFEVEDFDEPPPGVYARLLSYVES